MAQRIAAAVRAAIPSAVVTIGIRDRVVIEEYGINLTTQPVNDRIVVNGDRILFRSAPRRFATPPTGSALR